VERLREGLEQRIPLQKLISPPAFIFPVKFEKADQVQTSVVGTTQERVEISAAFEELTQQSLVIEAVQSQVIDEDFFYRKVT